MVNLGMKAIETMDLALIIFVIVIAFFLFIFSMLFLFQYKYIQKTKKLKEECNALKAATPIDQFKYLESLSKNNKQLKNIATSIANARKFYINQTKNLKSNIEILTSLSRNFFFIKSSKLIKIIEKDISHCNTLCALIKDVFTSATDYNESSAAVVSKFREVYSLCIEFYRTNLMFEYDKTEIFHLAEVISRSISNSDEYVIGINNEELINIVQLINENECSLLKTIKTIYVYRQAYYYFSRCKIDLDEKIKHRSNILNQKEKNEIQKNQIDVKIHIDQLKESLRSLSFNKSLNLILIIANKIEPNINLFNENEQINILLDLGMKFVSEQLVTLSEKYFELNKAFQSICEYFKDHEETQIRYKIENLIKTYKKINIHVEGLKNQQKNSNYIDRISFMKEIKQTIEDLNNWTFELEQLYYLINKTYQQSIDLIDNLYDAEWAISQMLSIKKEIDPYDEESFKVIADCINKINNIKSLIRTNYQENYPKAVEIINEIKKSIEELYNSYFLNKSIQMYARNLIFFANKYRYEDEIIAEAIDNSEKLYKEYKYTECIDNLLPVLNHIKQSAQASHIKFN